MQRGKSQQRMKSKSSNNNSTSTAAAAAAAPPPPQRPVRRSIAVAFGRNYYHALGDDQYKTTLWSSASVSSSMVGGDASSSSTTESSTTATSTQTNAIETVEAYVWDHPPWVDAADAASAAAADQDIQDVACTTQSTLFLTKNGHVYQTGTVHGKVLEQPMLVTIPLPLKCVQIAAGRHFCLGRMEGGLAVVSWGAGHFGQLGISSNTGSSASGSGGGGASGDDTSNHVITYASHPVVIERLLPHVIGSSVASVAAGDWHALALTESGRVWAWGSNRNLQCGRRPPKESAAQASAPTVTLPLPVGLEVAVQQIAAGRSHSVALSSGQVYCWGSSNHGQCGNAVRRSSGIAPPRKVEGLSDLTVTHVAAGGNHTLAVTAGGRAFSWGANSEGQLGTGPAVPCQYKPRLIADLDFVAIAAGQEWKLQQRSNHSTNTNNSDDATKPVTATTTTSSSSSSLQPPKHPLQSVPRIASVFAGDSYSAAISTAGHVYIWGSNDAGQIGVPSPPYIPFMQDYYTGDSSSSFQHPLASSLRDLHVRTFDSRHNILLPIRIDCLAHLRIRTIGCGPNHVWCIGEERDASQLDDDKIGRTLYELQEGQRAKRLQRARRSLIAQAARETAAAAAAATGDVTAADGAVEDLTETFHEEEDDLSGDRLHYDNENDDDAAFQELCVQQQQDIWNVNPTTTTSRVHERSSAPPPAPPSTPLCTPVITKPILPTDFPASLTMLTPITTEVEREDAAFLSQQSMELLSLSKRMLLEQGPNGDPLLLSTTTTLQQQPLSPGIILPTPTSMTTSSRASSLPPTPSSAPPTGRPQKPSLRNCFSWRKMLQRMSYNNNNNTTPKTPTTAPIVEGSGELLSPTTASTTKTTTNGGAGKQAAEKSRDRRGSL